MCGHARHSASALASWLGFAAYASAVLSTAAVIVGLGEYTAPLLGFGAEKRLFSLAAAALVFGAGRGEWASKPSAWVWSTLTVAKLIPLAVLVLAFFFVLGSHRARPAADSTAQRLSWGRAVLVLVFPMQGFEIVPVPGSHVRSPARAIPIATIGSLVLCAGLYAVLHWACVSSVVGLGSCGRAVDRRGERARRRAPFGRHRQRWDQCVGGGHCVRHDGDDAALPGGARRRLGRNAASAFLAEENAQSGAAARAVRHARAWSSFWCPSARSVACSCCPAWPCCFSTR